MTHKEILEKAIQKAMGNGWEEYGTDRDAVHYLLKYEEAPDTYTWLFSHDFARALWGSGPDCALCGVSPHMQHYSNCIEGSNIWPFVWEWHLQQMVIADDPIEYLGKNLE